jgi:DNA-binding MarR family transcriptional regulator
VNELAAKLSSSPPLISRNLKELEERGLVERVSGKGRRERYYRSTGLAKRIMHTVKHATEPESKATLEEWRINELFNVLEDKGVSRDLQLSYSEALKKACLEHPRDVLGNGNAQLVFVRVATEPFRNDVDEKLSGCLSSALTHAGDSTQHIIEEKWVPGKLLPILLNNMKSRDEKVSVWSAEAAGKIAGLSKELGFQVRNRLLEVWFSREVKMDDNVGKEVCKQLLHLASQGLFETVRLRMQSKDRRIKAKAELLLKELAKCLL